MSGSLALWSRHIEFQARQEQKPIFAPCPPTFSFQQIEIFLELCPGQAEVVQLSKTAFATIRINHVVRNANAVELSAAIKIDDLGQRKPAIGIIRMNMKIAQQEA